MFGGLYYPPLYHYLLALVPRRLRLYLESMTGAIADSLLTLLFIFSLIAVLPYEGGPTNILIWALVFAFNPLLTYVGYGPRAYVGNARIYGQLFFAMAILSLYMVWLGKGYLWFITLYFI